MRVAEIVQQQSMTDTRQLKELLRARVTELASFLYPNGKREGAQWCVGSVNGEPGKSFKICLTGEKAGLWGDFADPGKHRRSLLDLWMTARNVDFKTALREAGEWAGCPARRLNGTGLNHARHEHNGNGAKSHGEPFDWQPCVDAFTQKHLERLSDWRGYSREFCSSLHLQKKLVGVHEGCLALPVHDGAGKVVGAHCRTKDGKAWFYSPKGIKAVPLVIGELNAGDPIHVFESQWDAFAYMDKSGEWDGIIITRGASNGALVFGLVPEDSTIHAWTQNDPAGEKWQRDICASTKAKARRVKIPSQYKDLNDYARAGATTNDLLAAMLSAELIREVRSESTASPEITQPQPFPVRCLGPVCEAMASAICDTVRVLESLPGCCILGILSAAIGRGLQVKSGPNRETRGNLYILASAESGSGKSETFRHAAKPFLDLEAQRVTAWKTEIKPGLLAEREVLKAEVATLNKSVGKDKTP